MKVLFNSISKGIFLEEVEHFMMQNSSDMVLMGLTYVSILLVLMTNGSLIYFIIRQDLNFLKIFCYSKSLYVWSLKVTRQLFRLRKALRKTVNVLIPIKTCVTTKTSRCFFLLYTMYIIHEKLISYQKYIRQIVPSHFPIQTTNFHLLCHFQGRNAQSL